MRHRRRTTVTSSGMVRWPFTNSPVISLHRYVKKSGLPPALCGELKVLTTATCASMALLISAPRAASVSKPGSSSCHGQQQEFAELSCRSLEPVSVSYAVFLCFAERR
eukprot:COSAG06_NODE_499_length_14998_cov_20.019934_16_plen_108_part_00